MMRRLCRAQRIEITDRGTSLRGGSVLEFIRLSNGFGIAVAVLLSSLIAICCTCEEMSIIASACSEAGHLKSQARSLDKMGICTNMQMMIIQVS
jgi:hypothetical protein